LEKGLRRSGYFPLAKADGCLSPVFLIKTHRSGNWGQAAYFPHFEATPAMEQLIWEIGASPQFPLPAPAGLQTKKSAFELLYATAHKFFTDPVHAIIKKHIEVCITTCYNRRPINGGTADAALPD